ncbi:MAG: hemolysin family protein [Parachlamydiaceae bacterium]
MSETALFWLGANFLTIAILAFFSMEEMACVSFNKIRLQFYVSQGSQRAEWLLHLLQNPAKLFGTTLIGVNVATFIGSECAREFHSSIGLSPDLAPLSQVFLVIVLGELAPMFAARRYSEHVALIGIPVIYFSSVVLTPAIWVLGQISKFANYCFGGQEENPNLFLTQDELQKVVEEQEEEHVSEKEDYTTITKNIFRLRNKTARNSLSPLTDKVSVSANLTVAKAAALANPKENFLLIYQNNLLDIVGIVYIKDLICAPPERRLKTLSSPPWFISIQTPLVQILKQFRKNSENIAIVIDHDGKACGYLAFEDILDEIFEQSSFKKKKTPTVFVDVTYSGETPLSTLKEELKINLPGEDQETLSNFLTRMMEHPPEEGEAWTFPPYEFIIKETTLFQIASVNVRTRSLG